MRDHCERFALQIDIIYCQTAGDTNLANKSCWHFRSIGQILQAVVNTKIILEL